MKKSLTNIAVSTHNPSGSVTVYVGGELWGSVTRTKAGRVWRDDKTGRSMGRMSIEAMRRKLSY